MARSPLTPPQPTRPVAAQYMALGSGILVAIVGGGHLAAWLTGSLSSGVDVTTITMKTNASLCLVLAGLTLALVAFPRPPFTLRLAARLCAATVLLVGAATLVEHLGRLDLGIDQLLAWEPPGAAGVLSPNRMGPPASLSFVLLGTALLLLTRRQPLTRLRAAHQPLAAAAGIAALVALIGYLYGSDELYGVARYTGIAWPTAASLLVLALGVLLVRPADGLMALVTSDSSGALLVRRLLPPAVFVPLGMGWLRLAGERAGWFDAPTGTSLMVLFFILAFSVMVIVGGRWVRHAEVTLRRNEDAALRQLTEIQAIYDSAHVGLCVFDRNLRYVRINRRLAEINGLPALDHIGKTVDEVVPGLAPLSHEIAERVFRTGEAVADVEFAGTTPSQPDAQRTFTEQWFPLKDPFGEIVGINVVVEEITARKRIEEELREIGKRLSAAVDIARLGIWQYDAVAGRPHLDDRCREVFGVPNDRAVSADDILAQVHADDRHRVELEVRRAVEINGLYDFELRVVRRDGTERWVVVRGDATRNGDDSVAGPSRYAGIMMDITERKRAEEALREANVQLAEADRRKDEFIAILSHELRNPLAPIRYALPLLGRERLADAAAVNAVGVIGRQIDHLTRLVDDLLDVSRVTRGTIELRREDVTLHSILKPAIEAASPAIVAGRHTLTTEVSDEAIWLRADPGRIAQAVTNLLNNSAKYTPAGGQIMLEVTRDGGEALIRVRDNGIGIEPEALPTLFEMFRQVSRAGRPQGGLGIGLAFAKRLVEMHGGSITATSPGVGKGSEFTVRLPVVSEAMTGDAPPAGPVAGAGERLKVLVVDDNADLVQMVATVLESAGHDVRKALDGRAAISVAASFRPDVVLLDIGMPIMDGFEVARELRRHPETANARLVAVTGWGQAQDRRRTEEAGFDYHLTKPTDPEKLRQLLAIFSSERAARGATNA